MKLLTIIPAMPVSDVAHSATFYREKLGFEVAYQEESFAIMHCDGVEIHLWLAGDQDWRTSLAKDISPVKSGAESFLVGTGSCRIGMEGVDELYNLVEPRGIVHPNGPLKNTDFGTREFAILDGDGNLITFFQRIVEPS